VPTTSFLSSHRHDCPGADFFFSRCSSYGCSNPESQPSSPAFPSCSRGLRPAAIARALRKFKSLPRFREGGKQMFLMPRVQLRVEVVRREVEVARPGDGCEPVVPGE